MTNRFLSINLPTLFSVNFCDYVAGYEMDYEADKDKQKIIDFFHRHKKELLAYLKIQSGLEANVWFNKYFRRHKLIQAGRDGIANTFRQNYLLLRLSLEGFIMSSIPVLGDEIRQVFIDLNKTEIDKQMEMFE